MKKRAKPLKLTEPQGGLVVRSEDGAVCCRLTSTRFGLCVERVRQYVHRNARLVHTAIFNDTERFLRWCDSDSVRFDYPVVSSMIRREGGALLSRHEHSAKPHGDHKEP